MNTVWKTIAGYEGLYEISSIGEIRRARKMGGYRYLLLRPRKDGYVTVCLCKGRQRRQFLVSRLVCTTFHGPCPRGMNCNHKDGVKANNAETNVEWVTYSQNSRHAIEVLGHSLETFLKANPHRNKKGKNSQFSKSYIVTDPFGKEIKVKGMREFCRRNGLQPARMFGMANGTIRAKQHHGFKCKRA